MNKAAWVGLLAAALMAHPLSLKAVTFTGTNQPGSAQDFELLIEPGSTNLAISVSGTALAYSHLLLKAGLAPSEASHDFRAAQNMWNNAVNLELPELLLTNYFLRVSTPNSSGAHAFTVTANTNVIGMRGVNFPATKAHVSTTLASIGPSSWHYFRVDIPTNLPGWRVVLSSSNSGPDLYVQRDTLPTASSYLKSGTGTSNDIVAFAGAEITPGTYFVGVNQAAGSSAYTLKMELIEFTQLVWDPGTAHLGTEVFSLLNTNAGDYYFRINVQNTALGAWRNALNVLAGEANLYLSKGTPPSPASAAYKSERTGSDGFVVPATAFSAGEDWYLMVSAGTNASWNLVSGEPFVTDLGTVATNDSSGLSNVVMGAEGMRFFRTTPATNQVAWRLWLNGATNTIYVRKNAAPLPSAFDLSQAGQMLVVPPYLIGGQLTFISVAGIPGTTNSLDSRAHAFTDLDFTGSTNLNIAGFPYSTFRVQVPADQLAWQVSVVVSNGNPNVALRRNFIPNENYNDAYSEAASNVTDSVTLVPDTLSDGTFYVTVYSSNSHACTLVSGPPNIPNVDYVSDTLNTDSNRVGWAIFKVPDINQQLGSLGWDLAVSNATPGTRIAIRRNRAPGIWNFRSPNPGSAGFYTLLSTTNFLQLPDNPLDVYYVGVYNPSNVLGDFTLVLRELTASPIAFNGGAAARTNIPAGKWQFFQMDIPNDAIGWDVRVNEVTSGSPQMVVRRDRLPVSLASVGFSPPVTTTNWPTGNQWAAGADWTGRTQSADGASENGRILTAGMGRPLEAGKYYVGVLNTTGSNAAMSYSLLSRGIGTNYIIPVIDLEYSGGADTNLALPARDLAVYRVQVPTNAPSWKTKLMVSSGDATMTVARGAMPNISANASGIVTNPATAGRAMRKSLDTPNEYFLQLSGSTDLLAGHYFIVVASEGQAVATNNTRIGTGTAAFTLTSVGALPITHLGTLETDDIFYTGNLDGGDSAIVSFSNLVDTLGFELTLQDKTGNPWMVSPASAGRLPNPGSPNPADTYGNEGGADGITSPDLITVAAPFDQEYVAIKARGNNTTYPTSDFTLRIRKLTADPLAFDGGVAVVTNQTTLYQYFKVVVPENAVGWDIRLTNVISGNPLLIVAKDYLALKILPIGWLPGRDTYWPSGADWIADKDWTLRSLSTSGVNENGRVLAMGMGQPLEPGTYYVGVYNNGSTSNSMSYSLISRGIGDGFSIPVVELPFSGGVATNTALPPREAAYYRVVVPPGVGSWQSKLTVTEGEALLVATTNTLPTVLSGQPSSAGRSMQKSGNEHFAMLAPNNVVTLNAGTNYLAVISEGETGTNTTRIGTGTSSFIVESRGALTPFDLGTALSGVELRHTNSLEAAEVCAYQFTIPPGATSVEVELLNRTGNPAMVLRPGTNLPNPGASSPITGPGSVTSEVYGNEGGWNLAPGMGDANSSLITLASPSNGVYSIMVKARQLGTAFTNASFILSLRTVSVVPVGFDSALGGPSNSSSVTNQNAGSWRFFEFNVPEGAFGWDLRVTNVTGGTAKLVLRRNALPSSLLSYSWSAPGYSTNWPGTNQWAAGSDWTRRTTSADNVNEENRILAMGMGQPLQPGTYYAGVFNSTTSNTLSYTLVSRGLGDGLSLPVQPLAFSGGRATNTFLAPREAAYYRVDVPANSRSLKVRLTAIAGEVMLLALKDFIPNVDTGRSTTALAGKAMQKAGNEHIVLLPAAGQTNLPIATYYFAVVGEGLNPATSAKVGSGGSSYEIVSEGDVAPTDLGVANSSGVVVSNNLQGGECAFYTLNIPTNTLAVELRLDNRVGNPIMVIATNNLPDPGGVVSGTRDAYGNDGGLTPAYLGTNIITIANPVPGTYHLAVKARANASTAYPDASYSLRLRTLPAPDLNFCADLNTNGLNNSASAVLLDNQRNFYRVVVPTNVNDRTVIGWELNVSQSSGIAGIRARRDQLPSDTFTGGMPFSINSAVIVPPVLTPGTWFVEVIGTNSTTYTLTSSNLTLQRPAWTMPGYGEAVTTPGLIAPEFGDSGVNTNGAALPGDQGTDLETGRYHFYAVEVPTNNSGLMAVQLAAISGNPDFCMRAGLPPTFSHSTNGVAGSSLDRQMTGNLTDYGNWVPLSGTTETRLKSGTWYIGVRAVSGANARYRLRVSSGQIQELNLDGGSALNQNLASNDWRYYRFQIPSEAPANWNLNFSQVSGDVIMHLRDTVPPGNGADNLLANIKDWATDQKNTGPYGSYDAPGSYSFSVPPLRPGSIYYVGFRAKADSSFSFTSSVSGATNEPYPEIAFYGGFVTNTVPPNGTLIYRILTPGDGLRWRHTSVHSNTVLVYMENGSLPTRSTTDDFRSQGLANSSIQSQFLLSYPWLPLQTYYLLVTNTSSVNQPFSFTMNGSSITADDDNDGMPDAWEAQYFGGISPLPTSDADGDGISNLNEYLDGTNPMDKASLRPRLTVNATNGTVNITPFASNYTVGASVVLNASPNSGYEFTGWAGATTTKTNPLTLVLTSNTTLTAKFRVPGDDFEQRISLAGFNPVANPLLNTGATKEAGEPLHAGSSGNRSLWWTWTAPTSGPVTASTEGSTFRTLLAAYTGASVSNLTLVSSNAAPAGTNGTAISFNAVAGLSYHFAVDGFNTNASGTVAFSLSMANAFMLTQPTRLTNGAFQFNVISAPDLIIRIEAGEVFGIWNIIGVITNTTGNQIYVDESATGVAKRYYRAALGAGVVGSTNPPVLSAPLRLPDGKFQFTLLEVTSRNVRIDAGPNPLSLAPLATLTNMTSPVVFTDSNAPAHEVRFYRALLQ